MKRETVQRVLAVQDQIQTDHALMADYGSAQASFLEMLPELTQAQQNTLMDYLGVCVEIHIRMLELSCGSE